MDTIRWTTTRTGKKVHGFDNGTALCRSNIRRSGGAGSGHTAAVTRYASEPDKSFCADCERTYQRLVFEGLKETVPEKVCICPARTDYHTYECQVFQAAHAAPAPTEENTMANSHRPRTGPLTPVQREVVISLMNGKRQKEVSKEIGVSEQYVSGELSLAASKLGVPTGAAACAHMATHLAYMEAAKLIEEHRPAVPEDEADIHVDHVLKSLADILRDRAARLMPDPQ